MTEGGERTSKTEVGGKSWDARFSISPRTALDGGVWGRGMLEQWRTLGTPRHHTSPQSRPLARRRATIVPPCIAILRTGPADRSRDLKMPARQNPTLPCCFSPLCTVFLGRISSRKIETRALVSGDSQLRSITSFFSRKCPAVRADSGGKERRTAR